MNDLLDHLMDPLTDGGHALPLAAGSSDLERLHTDDHWSGAWWEQVLTHTHDPTGEPLLRPGRELDRGDRW